MFNDWSDEKLKEELAIGFKQFVEINMQNARDKIDHQNEEITKKEVEVKNMIWELQEAEENQADWQSVLDRITFVTDLEKPVITIVGDNPMELIVGDTYVEIGANAIDNKDGDVIDNIIVTGTVDTSTIGTYTITYSATDLAGNIGLANRVVNVVEKPTPEEPVV